MENYNKYVNPILLAYIENEIINNTAEIQRPFMINDINSHRIGFFINAIIFQSIPDNIDLYFYNKTMRENRSNLIRNIYTKIFLLIKKILMDRYKMTKKDEAKIITDIKNLIMKMNPKNNEEKLMAVTNTLIKIAYEDKYDLSNFNFNDPYKFYMGAMDKLNKNKNFNEISNLLFNYLTTLISFSQIKILLIKTFGSMSFEELQQYIFNVYTGINVPSEFFEEKILYSFIINLMKNQVIFTPGYFDYITKTFEKQLSMTLDSFLKNDKIVELISKEREIVIENIQGQYLTNIMTYDYTREEIFSFLAIDNYNNFFFDNEYNILKNTIELFFSLKENKGIDKNIIQSMLKNHIISFELNKEIHYFDNKIEITNITQEYVKKTLMDVYQDEYVQEALELSKKINANKKIPEENFISFYAPSFEKKTDDRYHHITKVFSNWKKWYIFSLYHEHFNIELSIIDEIFYEILFDIFKHFFQSLIFLSENPEYYNSFKNVFFYFVNDNPSIRYYTKDPISSILHLFKSQLLVIKDLYSKSGFVFDTINERNIFSSIKFGISKLSDFIMNYKFILDGFTNDESVTFMDLLLNETLDLVDNENVTNKNTYFTAIDYAKTFSNITKISNYIYEQMVTTRSILKENQAGPQNLYGAEEAEKKTVDTFDNDLRYNFPININEKFFVYLNFIIDKNNNKELSEVSYTPFENKLRDAIKTENDKILFHRYKDLLNNEKIQNTFIINKPSKSDDVEITMEDLIYDDDEDTSGAKKKIKSIDKTLRNSDVSKDITIMNMLKYLHKDEGEDINYIAELAMANIKIYADDASLYYSRIKEIKTVLDEMLKKTENNFEHNFLSAIKKSKEKKYNTLTEQLKKNNYSQTILNAKIEGRESYRKIIHYDNAIIEDLQASFDMTSNNRIMFDNEFETISSVLENSKSLKNMIIEQKKVLEHLFDFTFNHNNLITFFDFYGERLKLLVNKSRYKIKKLNFVDNFYSERKISIDIIRLLNIVYILMFENKNINIENINNYFNDFNSNIINDEVYLIEEEQLGFVINTTKDKFTGKPLYEIKLINSKNTIFAEKNKFINLTFMNKYSATILRGQYKNQTCVIHKYIKHESIPENVLLNIEKLKEEIKTHIEINEKIMYSHNFNDLNSEEFLLNEIDYKKMYNLRLIFIKDQKKIKTSEENKKILASYEKKITSKKVLPEFNFDVQIYKEYIIESKIKFYRKKLDSLTEMLRKKNMRNNKFVVTINYGTKAQKNIYIPSKDLKFVTEEDESKKEEITISPFNLDKQISLYELIEYIYNNLYVINEDIDMNIEYKDFYNFILLEIVDIINNYKEIIVEKHKIYKKNKEKLAKIDATLQKINNNEISVTENILDKLLDNSAALNLKLSQYDSFKELQEQIINRFKKDFEIIRRPDLIYYHIINKREMSINIVKSDAKKIALNDLKYNENILLIHKEQTELLSHAFKKFSEKF